jgi:hypothetical protein
MSEAAGDQIPAEVIHFDASRLQFGLKPVAAFQSHLSSDEPLATTIRIALRF